MESAKAAILYFINSWKLFTFSQWLAGWIEPYNEVKRHVFSPVEMKHLSLYIDRFNDHNRPLQLHTKTLCFVAWPQYLQGKVEVVYRTSKIESIKKGINIIFLIIGM